jgi:hypothetical protein
VVSIFPREIDDYKPTLSPGRFTIPPGSFERPAVLVVTSSSWWKETDIDQPLLEIPTSSIQIADSIIKDFCNGILGCNMGDTMLGLFFVAGDHTWQDIKQNHLSKLIEAQTKQRNWYSLLVKMADTLWSRSGGNPVSIADDMKLAARELNLSDKEWLKDFHNIQRVQCIACGTMINANIIVCPNCKVVLKSDEFKKMGLSFAQ